MIHWHACSYRTQATTPPLLAPQTERGGGGGVAFMPAGPRRIRHLPRQSIIHSDDVANPLLNRIAPQTEL